jgi:cell division protein FtsN
LKAALANAKIPEKPTPLVSDSLHNGGGNEALLGQMKTISDRYYEVVKQVDDALLAQMKVASDTNQAQIDRLKARLAAIEATKAATKISPVAEATKTLDNLINAPSTTEKAVVAVKPSEKPANNNVVIRTSESDDFSDETGKPATTGFYVVIGTFGNKDNVERFKAANIIKGHVNTKIIQNNFTKVYRVYVLKTNNRADAEAERAKYKAEYADVWILKLE